MPVNLAVILKVLWIAIATGASARIIHPLIVPRVRTVQTTISVVNLSVGISPPSVVSHASMSMVTTVKSKVSTERTTATALAPVAPSQTRRGLGTECVTTSLATTVWFAVGMVGIAVRARALTVSWSVEQLQRITA